MTIDAHQHFWRVSRGDYFWMDEGTAPIQRDLLPGDLAPLARAGGINGSVLVQAAPTIDETLFLKDIAETEPFVRAVVGWIDLEGDVDVQLERIAHPKLRGLRPMLQDIEQTDWIARPDVRNGLRKVADAGLRLDALITPRHLSTINALAAEMPELPIVIDHCAKPQFDGSDPGDTWRRGIAMLAGHPQVTCKLSGLANEYGMGWSAEGLRPVFDHVMETFGPSRTMWGSDWPVLELAGDYAGWLDTARRLAEDLSEGERGDLFGGTATRFYDL
ncbi:amidohydrolase family protein [Palleronia sp. LCG004]|uniref:amidohydrolase family protein n=1 Tax=Palleronia sp. LCG004 TaxID=3079304 RepID=UPI002941DE84|nr:amidohydrolase family protein [Palleronia sp. LCG004]WOI55852.1 amidohydrolase family protein [Palleronia sp. LCG004]